MGQTDPIGEVDGQDVYDIDQISERVTSITDRFGGVSVETNEIYLEIDLESSTERETSMTIGQNWVMAVDGHGVAYNEDETMRVLEATMRTYDL